MAGSNQRTTRGQAFQYAVLACLVSACGGKTEVPEDRTLPAELESSSLECAAAGFPCSWDEVPPEIERASFATADEVARRIGAGEPWLDVAQEVAEREGVAEVLVGEETIRFRLDGGRPEWIFASTRTGTIGALPGVDLNGAVLKPALPDPVGLQQVPKKPTKRALLISPFAWQWSIGGEDDRMKEIERAFQNTRDYQADRIVVRENSLAASGNSLGISMGVSLESFKDWDTFDAIHLSTHGGKACRRLVTQSATTATVGTVVDITCQTSLSIGVPWVTQGDPLPGKAFTTETGVSRAWIPVPTRDLVQVRSAAGLAPQPIDTSAVSEMVGPFVGVSTDFFRQQYGNGLSEVLVFLSACSSGANSDLVSHLSQGGSTVVGWERDMLLEPASRAAACVWHAFLGQPTTDYECLMAIRSTLQQGANGPYQGGASAAGIKAVIQGLFATIATTVTLPGSPVVGVGGTIMSGGDSGSVSSASIAAAAAGLGAGDLNPNGDDRNRAVEIVRLMEVGTETEVADSGYVFVLGTPGDGVADSLLLEIEVFGIDDTDEPDAMALTIDVDGVPQSAVHRLIRKQTPDRHRTVARLPLDRDLVPNDSIDVGVTLVYPDGTSRWSYEKLWYGCQSDHNGDIQGTLSGGYTRTIRAGGEGGRAWLRPVGDGTWSFGAVNRFESDVNLEMMLPREPTTGETLVVQDTDLFGMPGMAGGIAYDEPDKGAFLLGDVVLRFDTVGARIACGTLTGSVTALASGGPSAVAPIQISADVDLRFWAEIRR